MRAFSPRSFSPPQASSAAAVARRANASPPRSFPSLLTAGDVSTTAGEWSDIELASIAAAPTAPDGETATPLFVHRRATRGAAAAAFRGGF